MPRLKLTFKYVQVVHNYNILNKLGKLLTVKWSQIIQISWTRYKSLLLGDRCPSSHKAGVSHVLNIYDIKNKLIKSPWYLMTPIHLVTILIMNILYIESYQYGTTHCHSCNLCRYSKNKCQCENNLLIH